MRGTSYRNPAETARRVDIMHRTAGLADELLRSDDLLPHLDAHERALRLSALVGDVASDVWRNGCADVDTALLRLHAETVLWLEALARERAA